MTDHALRVLDVEHGANPSLPIASFGRPPLDVIEAQTERQRARVDLLAVRTEYIVSTYRLRAALGTLLERER